ncbi:MAG: OmpA family protein [Bacteroidetes bacterium]|nr:OmpA family protein [Bacteroidota bacterium]
MKTVITFLFSYLLLSTSFAQVAPNVPKDAKVDGSIVDINSRMALNNELIVFRSHKNGNDYQAVSDEGGKFSTRLPTGDQYDIFIMGFKDSVSQNVLNIPSLGANAFYKDAFKVNLEFEPSKIFVLNNVEFDFGKATLRPESYAVLDDLVEYLKRKPRVRIEIGGHTDNVGTDAKNKILSLERAKSIVAYLIAKGIEESRVEAKGYGADEPIEENNTEEGRQKNRRTEVKVLDEQ